MVRGRSQVGLIVGDSFFGLLCAGLAQNVYRADSACRNPGLVAAPVQRLPEALETVSLKALLPFRSRPTSGLEQ